MQEPAAERLFALWREIVDLSRIGSLVGWDQETYLPPGGRDGRAQQLATLAGIHHAKITSRELADAIDAAADAAEPGSVLEAHVREARRVVDRAARVPAELAKALASAKSRGLPAWQSARKEADWALFAPNLEELVRLRREEAAAIDSSARTYDVMLDEYEPHATEAQIASVFDDLRAELSPLVQAAADSGRMVDETPAAGCFPAEKQRALGVELAKVMGFDFDAGRLDQAAHPFCTTIDRRDVRLTWRYEEDDFRPALFGILHEAGHGLYEQGLPLELAGTPIGEAASMGVHESQSRLWENIVGRSRAFWRFALPVARETLGLANGPELDALWPALNTCRPSLIRVEADEATYNLHVIVRFDLERRLFGGELEVADLPAAWDDAYEECLGVRAPDVSTGVLQDIHWSMGAFGYFPTYALGNLMAAQLYASAERELGPQEEAFATGEVGPLLGWLRENVHRHGTRYPAAELIERATGAPLSPDSLLRRLRGLVEEVYGVSHLLPPSVPKVEEGD
jgi:carboxypeptidase Taq